MDYFRFSGNAENNVTNYAAGAFIKTYQQGDAIYYASFHPEMYSEEDGLDQTGKYVIILLQPSGLCQFYVVKREGKWVPYYEDENLGQVDEVVNNILNGDDDLGEEHFVENKNFPLLIPQKRLDWVSDSLNEHLK